MSCGQRALTLPTARQPNRHQAAHLRQRLSASGAQAGRGRLTGRYDEKGCLAAGLCCIQGCERLVGKPRREAGRAAGAGHGGGGGRAGGRCGGGCSGASRLDATAGSCPWAAGRREERQVNRGVETEERGVVPTRQWCTRCHKPV